MKDTYIINGDARHLDFSKFHGPYRVILADPPWRYTGGGDQKNRRLPQEHYKDSMTSLEITKIPVSKLAHKDSVLILWGTWPMLPRVLETMKAWGFKYATGLPWIKTGRGFTLSYGQGFWLRGVSEFFIIGKRGKAAPTRELQNSAGLIAENLYHSRKPNNIHELAEKLPGPYLELFARRPREGWTVFGNEIEKDKAIF